MSLTLATELMKTTTAQRHTAQSLVINFSVTHWEISKSKKTTESILFLRNHMAPQVLRQYLKLTNWQERWENDKMAPFFYLLTYNYQSYFNSAFLKTDSISQAKYIVVSSKRFLPFFKMQHTMCPKLFLLYLQKAKVITK